MRTSRMEAFSDGVIAIIITIMVLELKVPPGEGWSALREVVPSLLTYLLSFTYLAIYWNNHHHMLQAVDRIDGVALWANLHLLFWLSLVPFVTAWMDHASLSAGPTATYGVVLLMASIAYLLLQRRLMLADGPGSRLLDRLTLLCQAGGEAQQDIVDVDRVGVVVPRMVGRESANTIRGAPKDSNEVLDLLGQEHGGRPLACPERSSLNLQRQPQRVHEGPDLPWHGACVVQPLTIALVGRGRWIVEREAQRQYEHGGREPRFAHTGARVPLLGRRKTCGLVSCAPTHRHQRAER